MTVLELVRQSRFSRRRRLPGSGPAAAGSNEVSNVPGHIMIPEQHISMTSTRSRHSSARMATAC
jgi:hypothetical protein